VNSSPDESDSDLSPVPPGVLFVAADEPLLIYSSVAEAECSLEGIDVEAGVYWAAYGPNGESYRVGSNGRSVIIELTGGPNEPEQLRALLSRYLETIGRAPDISASLEDLVASAWATYRPSKPLEGWCCFSLFAILVGLLFLLVPKLREPLTGILIALLILWPVGVLAKRRADQTDFRSR
jgi:hypothetical protein